MAKIKGWNKLDDADTWFNPKSKRVLKLRKYVSGPLRYWYFIVSNKEQSKIFSTYGNYDKKEQAYKEAMRYMRRHPKG